jgi:hypothetical protein
VWVRTTFKRTKPRSANTILVGTEGLNPGPCQPLAPPRVTVPFYFCTLFRFLSSTSAPGGVAAPKILPRDFL